MKAPCLPFQRSISRRFPFDYDNFRLRIVRNDSQLETYLRTIIFPNITDSDYQALAQAYPADVTQGSPFDTELSNALTPEYKRISSFIGDFTFQAPRRLFLDQLSDRQNAWAYRK
jgi:acetylcholinesterase